MGGCASKPKAVKAETAEIPLPPENCTVCDSKGASERDATVPVADDANISKPPVQEVIDVNPSKVQEIIVEDGPGSNRRQSLGNLFKESEEKELAAANRETEVVPKEAKEELKNEAPDQPVVESKPDQVKAGEASPSPFVDQAVKPDAIVKVEEADPQVPTVAAPAAKPEVIKVEEPPAQPTVVAPAAKPEVIKVDEPPQVPTVPAAAKPEAIKLEESPQVPTVVATKPEVKTVVDEPPPSKPTAEVKPEKVVAVPEQEARPAVAVPAEVLKREVAVTSPAAPAAVKVEEKQKEVVAVAPSTTTTTRSTTTSAEASSKLPSEVPAPPPAAEKKPVDDSGKRPEGGDAVKTVVAVAK